MSGMMHEYNRSQESSFEDFSIEADYIGAFAEA
jgi:hypothetical protein